MYIYTYIDVYIFICIHTHIYTYIYIHICVYVYTYTYMRTFNETCIKRDLHGDKHSATHCCWTATHCNTRLIGLWACCTSERDWSANRTATRPAMYCNLPCNTLQHTETPDLFGCGDIVQASETEAQLALRHTATYCNTLQHTATHCNALQHQTCLVVDILRKRTTLERKSPCNTLQHTATHCNILQHTATHCQILLLTATHCNTLQHTALPDLFGCGHRSYCASKRDWSATRPPTQCNILQHTATYCNTLQHTATPDLFGCGHTAQASETGAQLVRRLAQRHRLVIQRGFQHLELALHNLYIFLRFVWVLRCVAVCCSVLQCVALC